MAVNETTNAQGGYAVPSEYITEIYRLTSQYGVARKVFDIKKTNFKSGVASQITAIPTVYYPDEGDAGTVSTPTWAQKTFSLKRFAVRVEMTDDWLEDTFASAQDVINTMTEAMAKDEDRCIFLGDGTTTYNSITGLANIVLTAYTKNVIDMDSGDFTLESILEGQTVISENKGNATAFIVSPRGLKSLALVKDGDGKYLFRTYENNVGSQIMANAVGLINGTIPVYVSQTLTDYETANSKGIAFMVDGRMMAKIVDRYNDVKFKSAPIDATWKEGLYMYTRLDFMVLFPQLLVRYEDIKI